MADRRQLEGAKHYATVSFVLGLLSLTVVLFFLAPFAAWNAHRAKQVYRRYPEWRKAYGQPQATAGEWIGAFVTVLGPIVIAGLVASVADAYSLWSGSL